MKTGLGNLYNSYVQLYITVLFNSEGIYLFTKLKDQLLIDFIAQVITELIHNINCYEKMKSFVWFF